MAAELSGILDVLETDDDFRALISGEVEEPESDIDPSITVGVPEGLRPALAAGAAGREAVPAEQAGRARCRFREGGGGDGRGDSFLVRWRPAGCGPVGGLGNVAS